MTTQTQGKGKKKNKETMKLSLDEFNNIDAPVGHSVVSVKLGGTGLDWAETMANQDQQATETQQMIVPAAPRAQRGPGISFEDLPDEGPFKVHLFNLAVSVEEKEIKDRFFQGLEVVNVECSKSSTTVEFASKNDLYDALCKDGSNLRGKTVNVCLPGHQPQNNYADRYSGRGSNSSYGDRDRYGDRGSGGFGGSRTGDRFGDRTAGGYTRDRDNYNTGYNRTGGGGFGGQRERLGYGERFNDGGNFRDNNRSQYTSGGGEPEEEPTNWRARPTVKPTLPQAPPASYSNNGSRAPYMHPRPEPSHYQPQNPTHQQPDPYYQPRYHNQPPNNSSYSQFNNQASSNNRQLPPPSTEERRKLVLSKRKTPINVDDVSSVSRNEAIFGQAKPSSTPYQKMNEVEEKLKKAVQISDREVKPISQSGSQHGGSQQGGSQPGSAPRSRRVSSNHSESNT